MPFVFCSAELGFLFYGVDTGQSWCLVYIFLPITSGLDILAPNVRHKVMYIEQRAYVIT